MNAMMTTQDIARAVDPLLRLHDSSVRSAVAEIQAIARDLPAGLNSLDLRLEQLPDAVEAVLANALSAEAIATLHRLTAEVLTRANSVHTQATKLRQLGTHGRTQLEKFEMRLAEVRQLDVDGVPCDESTVNGDLAEEHDAG